MYPYETKKCRYCNAEYPKHKHGCPMLKKRPKNKLNIAITVILSLFIFFVSASIVILGITVSKCKIKTSNISSESGIEVSKKLFGDVKITIPKDFVLEGIDLTVSEAQKKNGLKSIEKNSDGSVVYTIKGSKYNAFLEEMRNECQKNYDEMLAEGSFASLKSVKIDKNFNKITVTADKSAYADSLDSAAKLGFGLAGMFYQKFDTNASGKVTVEVIDQTTKEVIDKGIYPDDAQDLIESLNCLSQD